MDGKRLSALAGVFAAVLLLLAVVVVAVRRYA